MSEYRTLAATTVVVVVLDASIAINYYFDFQALLFLGRCHIATPRGKRCPGTVVDSTRGVGQTQEDNG